MKQTPPSPVKLLSLGIPVIDAIAPSTFDWARGTALIARFGSLQTAAHAPPLPALHTETPAKIAAAQTALTQFAAFCVDRGYQPGDKQTLTHDDAAIVAGYFETMLTAARAINQAARLLEMPEQELHLRHVGGTMTNKFHAIKAALGDRVATHLLGAVGEEDISGTRARLLERLEASGIDFQQFDQVHLGPMAVSYVYSAGQDRIVLRSPIDRLAEQFATQIATLDQRIDAVNPDIYFLEGSDIGGRKFGRPLFEAFATRAFASGKPVIFSPPTDTDMLRDANLCALMTGIAAHSSTRFMAMNESEAVALFGASILPPPSLGQMHESPALLHVLQELAQQLAAKKSTVWSRKPEPLAFVSVGIEGAFYVTARGHGFVPSHPSAWLISAVGAGDAFMAGVFAAYIKAAEQLRQTGGTRFTDDILHALTATGQRLGRATTQIKGAQLPRVAIRDIMNQNG